MKGRIKVYRKDEPFIREALVSCGAYNATETQYNENDFFVSYLREVGLWDAMIGSSPEGLHRGNGYPWEILQQVGMLHELSQAGRLVKIGPLVSDGKLMTELGFNMEYVEKRLGGDKGVIHTDTLRNHYKRKCVEQSLEDFYGQVSLMRASKWLRGGIYVADGFKIVVSGKTFEGMGKVWDDNTKTWQHGYKVVLLMNVEQGRERLVGFSMGAINVDERDLLRRILNDIKRYVCPPRKMIDLIIFDRGYWGMDFLSEIHKKWKLDFLIMAKKNLEIVKYEIPMVANTLKWQQRTIKEKDRHKREQRKKIKVAKYEGIGFKVQRKKGPMTAVIEKDPKGSDALTVFLTTQEVKEPVNIIKQYKRRWAIENEGIRELSQKHKIRELAGRTLNSITARIALAFMTYNALKIFKMKWQNRYDRMFDIMKRRRSDSWLKGKFQVVTYVQDRFAVFPVDDFGGLIFTRGKNSVKKELLSEMQRAPPEIKRSLDEIISRVFQES
jgi:hypothetical protein